jgi:hypothetical protein
LYPQIFQFDNSSLLFKSLNLFLRVNSVTPAACAISLSLICHTLFLLIYYYPATAAFSHEGMHAAHEVNGPLFAHAILTTKELLGLLPAEQR